MSTDQDTAAPPAPAEPAPGTGTDRADASSSTDATPSGSALATEIASLDRELAEVELLVAQARTEAERHEARRAQTADKVAQGGTLPPEDLATLNAQLVSLTKRAAIMEAQVEILEGKHKVLVRFRDALVRVAEGGSGTGAATGTAERAAADGDAGAATPDAPAMSPLVLSAQEDLRREIARAMHDGPAQSLTNIVLQAQIVERMMSGDPDAARGEVRQLVSMVQQTLDATKTFIFDVRPMVLDDLGLVPTLRRAARDRGRRAGLTVDFESMGQDRRLAIDVESSLFRILDEALATYVAAGPDRVTLRLNWTEERLEARVAALRDRTAAMEKADRAVEETAAPVVAKDLPPALAEMMADRREAAEAAAVAAREAAIVALPAETWREIQGRARAIGIAAELLAGGGELHVAVDLPDGAPTA